MRVGCDATSRLVANRSFRQFNCTGQSNCARGLKNRRAHIAEEEQRERRRRSNGPEIERTPTRFRRPKRGDRWLSAWYLRPSREIARVPSNERGTTAPKGYRGQEEVLCNVNNNLSEQSHFGSHGTFTTDKPQAA